MNRRDRLAVASLVFLLAIVGAAMVVPSGAPEPTAPASPGSATAAPSATYREGVVGHPSSIDPLTARTQVDRDLVALLFRGLLRPGPDGGLLPDLAESYTVSADGKTYTFTMRSDARWEDGQPVTPADVIFTVALAQDPDYDGPLGATWQGIKATAVGTSAVRFTLTTPMGGFLRQALLPILPEHLLGDTAVTDLADSDFSARPMGDGPFRITELDDAHVLLTRVAADYPAPVIASPSGAPAAKSGAPATKSGTPASAAPSDSISGTPALPPGNVKSVDMVFYDDQASAVADFMAGKLDALAGPTPDSAGKAASRSGAQIERYRQASLYTVVLNRRASHPEFATLSVRSALLEAIDRQAVLKTVLLGRGTIADAPLPSWSPAFDAAAVTRTPYDPARAAADLTAAGWVRDPSGWTIPNATSRYSIRLLTPDQETNPVAFRMATQVSTAWTGLGLSVSLQAVGAADYNSRLTSGDFDSAVVDYQLGLDPDVSPLLLSTQAAPAGSNLSGIADRTLDGLLLGVRTTSEPVARQAAVSALEKYVSANVLMLPLCFADYEFVVSGRVKGAAANQIADPSTRYWDVLDWRLASDG
jgi:peptide/nickel transport system substrate-binding protein